MILDWTKRNMAYYLIGSTADRPTYFMIGSGSGTVTAAQTTLFNPSDRQEVTSTNGSTAFKVKWTGDWNSVELSGTTFSEWGMTISGTGTTGSMWSKTGVPNTFTFDGTTELRIEETWEVY